MGVWFSLCHDFKLDCAPSGDGITAEHLLYGMNSTITSSIAQMLTLCIKAEQLDS